MRIESLHDLHLALPDVDGFWNYSDLNETENRIRSQLPSGDQPWTATGIEVLTQLVRVYSLQGRRKEAHSVLESIRGLLPTLPDSERGRPEVRFFLEEGRLHCLSMYPAKALDSFVKAWKQADRLNLHLFAIDAAYMFSITLPMKQGKKWLHAAIELAEKSQESAGRAWLSHLYMMQGWHAFDTHDYSKALGFFESAIASRSANNPEVHPRTLLWCQARALRALGRIDEALKIQMGLQLEFEGAGETNGHVSLEIAECHLALNDPDKAKSFYETAHGLLKKDQWYSDNHAMELARIQKNSKN